MTVIILMIAPMPLQLDAQFLLVVCRSIRFDLRAGSRHTVAAHATRTQSTRKLGYFFLQDFMHRSNSALQVAAL